ncbi:MAG: DUF1801 domain-containing protein [Phyllobacteriaceae bacterium]|nr:DUF1801 domain-containing protein [Phyllobacteriaceae bacterium]
MTSDPVSDLLEKVGVSRPTNHATMVTLRALVQEHAPEAAEMIKYGGLHYVRTKPFCGIYSHAKHVSLEFSRGVDFDDGLLEGDGQFRRHLKFTDPSAVDVERVGAYIAASYQRA